MRSIAAAVLLLLFLLCLSPSSSAAVDFLFNSFNGSFNGTDIILIEDAHVEDSSVIRLVNESRSPISFGRAFHHQKLTMRPDQNSTVLNSFSTSFVFSILPDIDSSPGFGLCFFLSNSTSPPGALSSQYFGLFSNATVPFVPPLLAIEFDTGLNSEFNDPDGNHIGIDLNRIESIKTNTAGYYNSTDNTSFVPVNMRNGQNIIAWIDFDGSNFEINVSVAPVGVSRPVRPTLSYRDPVIANYVSAEMFVGFSASMTSWVEKRRILAWSLSDTGVARAINTTNLPVFFLRTSSSPLSPPVITGIVIGCIMFIAVIVSGLYLLWRKHLKDNEEDTTIIEDWELEYWPHRFTYEELKESTNNFSDEHLLGAGGFGKVYRGVLPNANEIAVKCVNHDSKQGLREFMAEISSMGRLQHKNLVQLRGWCRKANELMLVYDYMPNGSLNRWIFDKPKNPMAWKQRRSIITDVAEGLNYLHNGWDQVVIHRDIKSSNILLDSEMRGRLGDFGLAKLYNHGEVPNSTRVVGTLGYLAPELASVAAPTVASDVYSFGVVVVEIVCGRRPIELAAEDEEVILVDWVRELYGGGRVSEAVDGRLKEEEVYEEEEVEMMLKLGLACCHPNPIKRPTMKEVTAFLIGEEESAAAMVPAELLSELGGGGDSGNDSDQAPLRQP